MSRASNQSGRDPVHLGEGTWSFLADALLVLASLVFLALAPPALAGTCKLVPESTPPTNKLAPNAKPFGVAPDLEVTDGECTVPAGTYYFRNVNIHSGGKLKFEDATTDFWAYGIIVENNGGLIAGSPDPIGTANSDNVLTIHLYGQNLGGTFGTDEQAGIGVPCRTPEVAGKTGPCGIPAEVWGDGKTPTKLGNGDLFYQYGGLPYDNGKTPDGKIGYFGYKVLAVSYGGTLNLFGKKGALKDADEYRPLLAETADYHPTGNSWARLQVPPGDKNGRLDAGSKTLTLDHPVDWEKGDHVVIATTDYLPSHSEELQITDRKSGTRFEFTRVENCDTQGNKACGVRWPHNGRAYDFSKVKDSAGKTVKDKLGLSFDHAETRAAVGLLSRNIRIVSGGNNAGDEFPDAGTKYHFGGHTLARQGFKEFKVQGVEFRWMGQGGKIGHYPVHFHLARRTTKDAYVKDSSINESMTRWIVIHGTGGVSRTAKDTETVLESVLLARNVGYKSIGHGFYLEDGSEANNRLYYNLGVFARAAVVAPAPWLDKHAHGVDPHNPRHVPGILAAYMAPYGENFPYRSDYDHPTVFWIMNAWNEFVGNMAAGAGTCGTAYWFVPGQNSGPSGLDYDAYLKSGTPKVVDGRDSGVDLTCANDMKPQMEWLGYASLQQCPDNTGGTPIKRFSGNSAVASMNSLQTVAATTACLGVSVAEPDNQTTFQAVRNDLAPTNFAKYSDRDPYPQRANVPLSQPCQANRTDCAPGFWGKLKNREPYDYYPTVTEGAVRKPTLCPDESQDCSKQPSCGTRDRGNCAVNVIDHYTTSFHWAETNFSAVWLRSPAWFLFTDSVVSDVQNGGLTFVTGGGYSRSDAMEGFWSLARKSVFIGKTQEGNTFAASRGPFTGNPDADGKVVSNCLGMGKNCVSFDGQISMPLSGWAVNQRLFNIYDGPSMQESNAYLDIQPTVCPAEPTQPGECDWRKWMYGAEPRQAMGIRRELVNPDDPKDDKCYLPHAAIGWKQPNGFYYPPAFHSANLFFHNVGIRHYLIEPVFESGTYRTHNAEVKKRFCGLGNTKGVFKNFTDIDRQTFLNDDDGSLTGLCAEESGTGALIGTCSGKQPGFAPRPGLRETISVNADDYFNTPAEVPECRSNLGVGPASACGGPRQTRPTAKTSPEEYVSTVVYPSEPLPNAPNPWSSDCANERCFGIRLFRQLLTPKEHNEWANMACDKLVPGKAADPKCLWPFIRMAGQNIGLGQRSTLTVNQGTYYIDTTVPESTQMAGEWIDPTNGNPDRYINVFQKGRTYNVFFVFAKEALKQKYQIYVGGNLPYQTDNNKLIPARDFVYPVRANTEPGPVRFAAPPAGKEGWPDYLAPEYDPSSGILTVNVDLSGFGNLLDPRNPKNGQCSPKSFCQWKDEKAAVSECVSALPVEHPLRRVSEDICGIWAVKDLDCPLAPNPENPLAPPVPACIGFAFKIPEDGFAADGANRRPRPEVSKTTGSTLVRVGNAVAGQCTYTTADLDCLPKK